MIQFSLMCMVMVVLIFVHSCVWKELFMNVSIIRTDVLTFIKDPGNCRLRQQLENTLEAVVIETFGTTSNRKHVFRRNDNLRESVRACNGNLIEVHRKLFMPLIWNIIIKCSDFDENSHRQTSQFKIQVRCYRMIGRSEAIIYIYLLNRKGK
jgi:hypothetical protein